MGQETTAISERQVYAQETQPADTRDGVLWVDTSKSPRETFVYSTDTESWEPTQTSIETIQSLALATSDGFAPGFMG